ncbi:MAG TPA: hypothetical protein VH934_07705 [Xanthobacteraceae bacterium]|jgi:hypothetical protein
MTNGSDNVDQFLIAPASSAAVGDLADFEQALQAVPGAAVLTRAGRPDQPRLVVAMPTDAFEQLRARFGATLIMERNAPLTPLSP